MSKLENIESKIFEDAQKLSNEIIEKANRDAQEKYNREIKKYYSKVEQLEESATRERELAVERLKSNAVLRVRNEKLEARQSVISKIITQLKEELININEVEYINYIRKNIDFNEVGNKKITVMEKYVESVKKEFPNLNLEENIFVTSGFILEENGIQENYTFEVKLDFMRDELEVEVSKMLFS